MRKTIIISFIYFIALSCSKQVPEMLIYSSKYLKCDDTCLVFSPAKANREHVPTLFLLHGWSGCYRDWNNKYDIQEISNRTGFRIICPDGFYNSWYLDNVDTTQMQWRSFWNKEFLPSIIKKYNLHPESTFITGLSMGGHGAIILYLDHPELFRSAGSMSGVLNLQDTSLKETELAKVIGAYSDDNALYDKESAYNRIEDYISNYPEASTKILLVSCGYEDVYAKCTRDFSDKCHKLGIPHVASYSKAPHSWKYWGYALEEHIWQFDRMLRGENMGF